MSRKEDEKLFPKSWKIIREIYLREEKENSET